MKRKISKLKKEKYQIFSAEKVIYFCDPMFTSMVDSPEEEYEVNINPALNRHHIEFENVTCTIDSNCLDEICDVFFFDWGGMSVGNSCLEHLCREIRKLADDRPNTYYVVVSEFTQFAMIDALLEFGKEKPFNIFLDIDSFVEYFKKHKGTNPTRVRSGIARSNVPARSASRT
ncbi:MAG: hypothetical protein LLG40_11290 [Deltaproteobacteria bacterium]|nr:hypothetical protein [Deltaproteobacteria bacterium]